MCTDIIRLLLKSRSRFLLPRGRLYVHADSINHDSRFVILKILMLFFAFSQHENMLEMFRIVRPVLIERENKNNSKV